LVSLAVGLLTIKLAHEKNIFIDCHHSDKPQRFHEISTPRAGGIAIFVASLSVLSIPFGIQLLLPMLLAFASGLIEDYTNAVSQKTRLLIQSVAALSFIFIADAYIKTIGLAVIFPYPLAVLFTVFAMVGVTNAINIIDGLNGLAGGVSASALIAFGALAYILNDSQMFLICMISLAAILGFLVLNFPVAKIFLGDGGAYFIGFMLAVISIMLVQRHLEVSAWFCASILAYPIWEVLYSVARRRRAKGKKAMGADKMHLHHVVMRGIGLSNPRTALLLVVSFLPFQLISLYFYDKGHVLFGIIVAFVLLYNITYGYLTKHRNLKNIRGK
jgi:UDP-GlcNAc:undecaprenyl-phosphate/decaprenyl-phosphate GlcNAc-1-phosphate transferase